MLRRFVRQNWLAEEPDVPAREAAAHLAGVLGLAAADRFLELCEVDAYDPYWDIVAALGGFDDEILARWTPREEEFRARAVAARG